MALLVTVLATIGVGIGTFFYPVFGLVILIICNPFDLPIEMGLTVYTNQLFLVSVFVSILIKNYRDGFCERFVSKTWIFAILPFIIAVVLSAINAEEFSSVIKQLLRWMEMVVAAWIGINVIKTKADINKVVLAILIAAAVASIIGIVQTIAGPEAGFNLGKYIFTVDKGLTMRAYSSFGHPNQFAGYLALMIPIAFIQFVEIKELWKRTFVGVLTILMITALIFTFSRGGWLAMILVGGVLIYLNIPKKMLMIISLILALTATIFILNHGPLEKTRNAVMQRMVSFSQPEKEDSLNFRGVCYKTAFKMFKKHPLVGFGAGEYKKNIYHYFDEKYYAWEAINKHIHNWYVQVLIETGLLGLITFAGLLGMVLFKMSRIFLRMEQNYERQILSAVIGAVLAFLIHNCFDVLTMFARGIHFGLVIGLGLSIGYMVKQTTSVGAKVE